MLFSQFLIMLATVCVKAMYVRIPELNPLQLMSYRAIFSFGINILVLNKNLKNEMIDVVKGDTNVAKGALAARVIQSNVQVFMRQTTLKFFTMTIVAVTRLITPFTTLILAYIFLDEKTNVC